MHAYQGKIVTIEGVHSNGSTTHPAIVTRVWSDHTYNGEQATTVNLTVFPDYGPPESRSSVFYFRTKAEAERAGCTVYAYHPE